MNVSNLCRGCMKEVASWERENFDTRAVEMFCFCTNIRITEEDRLPKQFCYDCIIKMESSYTFITEAQKVNVTLKNIISRTNSVIVEPDTSSKTINPTIETSIKLTLPDYKICSVIENDTRQFLDPMPNLSEETDHQENFDDNVDQTDETEISGIDKVIQPMKEANKEEIKNSVCLICKKRFISKTWYEKHMQKNHSGKKYVCPHCSKGFSRPSELRAHSVSHSEERQFSCSSCGKRFKRRKQLAVHARAHGDARPYTCDHCSARFKTKSILKSHMAVHEKDKPFLCSFCGWSFTQDDYRSLTSLPPPSPPLVTCTAVMMLNVTTASSRQPEGAYAPAHRREAVLVRRVQLPVRRRLVAAAPRAQARRRAAPRVRRLREGLLRYQQPGAARAHAHGRAAVQVRAVRVRLLRQLEAQDAPHARAPRAAAPHTAHARRRPAAATRDRNFTCRHLKVANTSNCRDQNTTAGKKAWKHRNECRKKLYMLNYNI